MCSSRQQMYLVGLVGLMACVTFSALWAQGPTREELARLAQAGEAIEKDFSHVSAPGLTLARCNLAGTTFRGADLRGATLTAVSLQKCDLRGANLRGAVLERVDLEGANLAGADLSGARLCLVNLENAVLTDCIWEGAQIEGVGFSLSGAPHLAALQLALQNATQQRLSRGWIAGLSGDAFAFAYNTDPAASRLKDFWPGVPFSVNPLLAAAQNLGLSASFFKETAAEKQLLGKLAEQTVYLLLLELPSVDKRLVQGQPVWAVLLGSEETDKGLLYRFQAPPFGTHELRRSQLFGEIWGGPWNTPEPLGTMLPARRQLVAINAGVPQPAPDQIAAALRQATKIITEKRTYGPLVPGEAGLLRLAADLRAVANNLDAEAGRRLLYWQRFPRQCLIGALTLAVEFLTEAAAQLPAEQEQACRTAKSALATALRALDTKWPSLSAPGEALTPQEAAAFAQAADIIAEVAAAEQKAAALFAQIAP